MWSKNLIILILSFFFLREDEEKAFLNQYKCFLTHYTNDYRAPVYKKARSPQQRIFRMSKLFAEAYAKNQRSVIKYDTLFIVESLAAEFPNSSVIIWDNHNDCYYYNYLVVNANRKNIIEDSLAIKINDPKVVGTITPFRKFVQDIDIAGFQKYRDSDKGSGGSGIRFTVAIKNDAKWQFIDSKQLR